MGPLVHETFDTTAPPSEGDGGPPELPTHALAAPAREVMSSPWFDRAVIGAIAVNSIFLAAADPTRDTPAAAFVVADYIFTALFTIELTVKLLGIGRAYFDDNWNLVDFAVVLESWYSLIPINTADTGLSALRAVRVLRPLRSLQRVPKLRVIIEAVITSVPQVASTMYVLVPFTTTMPHTTAHRPHTQVHLLLLPRHLRHDRQRAVVGHVHAAVR